MEDPTESTPTEPGASVSERNAARQRRLTDNGHSIFHRAGVAFSGAGSALKRQGAATRREMAEGADIYGKELGYSAELEASSTRELAEQAAEIANLNMSPRLVQEGMHLVTEPHRVEQGKLLKQIQAAQGFEVAFHVTLQSVPEETSSLMHFAIGGGDSSHLPSVSIVGGTTQVVARLRHGLIDLEAFGPSHGLDLQANSLIYVRLADDSFTLHVNGIDMGQQSAAMPPTSNTPMHVFLGSPFSLAADATVSSLVYRGRQAPSWKTESKVKELDLPPQEKRLLEDTQKTLENNKRWGRFDAFFGMFLVVNSCLIGIEIELKTEANASIWIIFNNVFIGIFVTEFVLRIRKSSDRTTRELMRDPWMIFDSLVLTISMIEAWALSDAGGYLGVIRLLRLMKLAKMVRLVRAFKELGILVEGLLYSFRTLFWTFVLLLLSTYIGAILLVRTARLDGEEFTPEEAVLLADFLDVGGAMWRLVQMSTFDDWAFYVRSVTFGIGGVRGYALGMEMMVFVCFIGLGILNMVAGVLCHTAFVLSQKHRRMRGAEVLLRQREAMSNLRHSLKNWGERPLFQSDQFIGTDEVFDVLEHDDPDSDPESVDADEPKREEMTPAKAAQVLELTGADAVALCDTFGENGFIEINGLIEAIGTKELQAYFALTDTKWMSTKIVSSIRSPDMVFFNFSSREIEEQLRVIERGTMGSCCLSYDIVACLCEKAHEAHTLLRMEATNSWAPPTQNLKFKPNLVDVRELEKSVTSFNLSAEESKIYMTIDIVFGGLICLNGAFIGLQVSIEGPAVENLFYAIDCLFTLAFTMEFVIRAILFANIVWVHTDKSADDAGGFSATERKLERFRALQKKMKLRMFPPCPPDGCGQVCKLLPKYLRDVSTFFDFMIILLSLADSVIIVNLRRAGLTSADPSALSILRVFRLFRLAKLLRIFKLFPHLQMLLFALLAVWHTIFWALLLMLLVIYAFSIYARTVLADYGELDAYYGSLSRCILSGWQLTTFDDWGQVVDSTVAASPPNFLVLFAICALLGLGQMKMIVGVMAESAISLARSREREQQREDLIAFVKSMAALRVLLEEELGTDLLLQEIVEEAMKLKMRPRRLDSDPVRLLPPGTMQKAMTTDFLKRVKRLFKEAQLSPDLVKQIFEKVDCQRRGYVGVDALAKGAIVVKEDLAKIELFASITAIRDMREKCHHISTMLAGLQGQLEGFLEDMSALVHRKRHEPTATARGHQTHARAQRTLRKSAEDALQDLCGGEAMPEIQATGKLKLVHGKGKLRFDDDQAVAVGAELRSQVKPGDLVLITVPGDPKKKKKTDKVIAMSVINIVGTERMKVTNSHAVHTSGLVGLTTFFIARRTAGRRLKLSQFAEEPTSYELELSGQYSPRSSQRLFEWDLRTKRRYEGKLKSLQQDKMSLMLEMMELEKDIEALDNRDLAQRAFEGLHSMALKGRGRRK